MPEGNNRSRLPTVHVKWFESESKTNPDASEHRDFFCYWKVKISCVSGEFCAKPVSMAELIEGNVINGRFAFAFPESAW
jgi:hypothetical protein